jgi:hypothetical protein
MNHPSRDPRMGTMSATRTGGVMGGRLDPRTGSLA